MKGGKIRVAVVGATGYGGAESVRLLLSHPQVEIVAVTSSRNPGQPLEDHCPWLATDLKLQPFSPDCDADVFFLCQEVGFAAEHAPGLEKHAKVIDFSADFRLTDAATYEATYHKPWPNHRLASAPVYGFPEWVSHAEIASARVIANPGCHPTAAILGLKPLLDADLVTGIPVIDSKTGVSGAGRSKTDTDYLFSEQFGSLKPYAVSGHRHIPEIEQVLGQAVRFTPHLLSVPRGIVSSIAVPVQAGVTAQNLRELFEEAYAGKPFVKVVQAPAPLKAVIGSNRAMIHADFDPHTGYAVVTVTLDNLVKGMAGQAIQNMNIQFGLPETTGLPLSGLWP